MFSAVTGAAPHAQPGVTCAAASMTGPTNGTGTRSQPVEINSLRNFKVTASLKSAAGVRYENLFFKSGNVPPLPPTLTLEAAEVGWLGRRTAMDTHLVLTLAGDERTQISTFQIPIPAAERSARINAHLDEMQRTGRTAPLTPAEFPSRRGDMYGALDAIYTQNRVGLFELTCTYTSRERGAWNGSVRSEPFYVQINDGGDFFDYQAQMRTN